MGALVVLIAVQLSVLGLYLPPGSKPSVPSVPAQTIISLPVHTAVNATRPPGALVVVVPVQVSALGLYLPPLFKRFRPSLPPQTIISLPVHTAL